MKLWLSISFLCASALSQTTPNYKFNIPTQNTTNYGTLNNQNWTAMDGMLPVYVGGAISVFGTGDIGSQINTAYAACPPAGCHIKVLASPTPYSFSTSIVFGTNNKSVWLDCDPGMAGDSDAGNVTGVTQLKYTGAGTAITFGGNGLNGKALTGCNILGPGTGGTTIGVLLGGSTGNFVGSEMDDFSITNFNVGLQIGNNTYLDTFRNFKIEGNGTQLFYPASSTQSGESMSFIQGLFGTKSTTGVVATCVNWQNTTIDANFTSVSFDQCPLTVNNANAGLIHIFGNNLHFENPSGPLTANGLAGGTPVDFMTFTGSPTALFICVGCDILEDNASTARTELITQTGSTEIILIGGDYRAAESIGQVITNASTNKVSVFASNKFNSTFWLSNFNNTVIYDAHIPWFFLGNGLPLIFQESTNAPPSTAGWETLWGDPTDHMLHYNANGGGTQQFPLRQTMASSSGAVTTNVQGQPGGMSAFGWFVKSGQTYSFDCELYYQISSVTGVPSPAMSVGGSATYTTLWDVADGYQTAALTTSGSVATASGTASTLVTTASTPTATNLPFRFRGAFTVNASGTFLVQAANSLNGGASMTIGNLGTCTVN
jgi:hypothetical protein